MIFFLKKQGELARRLVDLRSASQYSDPQAENRNYIGIGEELVLLVNFVELDVTGLRKILKKHDKRVYRTPLAERYLSP